MEQIILHTCCAPCSAAIIEWMLNHDLRPVLLYYNPNIFPNEEYVIRKNECIKYAEKMGLEIVNCDYEHPSWLTAVKGFEHEPERGCRCLQCFKMRLFFTAQYAFSRNIMQFATTLASSRWKNLDQISEAGQWAAQQFSPMTFYDKNWRKDGLQQRRNELLKENGFYNQRYCGCEFSMERLEKILIKKS